MTLLALSQVYESFCKFIKGQTTISSSLKSLEDNNDGIVFPSLTICDKNGFKPRAEMEKANMSNYLIPITDQNENMLWPNQASRVNSSWQQITFDLNELIDEIGLRYQRQYYYNCTKTPCVDEMKIVTLNTLHYGRCYTIEFSQDSKFDQFDNLIVTFKRDINVFLHGLGQNLGIIANFFPVEPEVYLLEIGHWYKLDLQAKEIISDTILGCQPQVTEASYYACAKDVIRQEMQNGTDCKVPMYLNVILGNWTFCSDVSKVKNVIRKGRSAMRSLIQMAVPQCSNPCNIQKYKTSPLIKSGANGGSSYLYLSLVTQDVVVEEVIRIFDGNGIIGTIGGSLGLFVGFSFLSCIKDLLNILFSRFSQ